MISLYSGTPGSGKSCHAAREIALRLQRKDSVVIGNFYFNTKAVKKCKGVYLYVPNHRLDPDKLLRFSRRLSKHFGRRLREGEVKIYIDEAQLLFPGNTLPRIGVPGCPSSPSTGIMAMT